MTPRQKDVFRFLVKYIRENGYSPTYREIAAGINVKDTKTVFKHLTGLRSKGHISLVYGKERSTSLTGEWKSLGQALRQELGEIRDMYNKKEYISVTAKEFGFNHNAPKWDDVLKGRRFDEPEMMVYYKESKPVYIPYGYFAND